MLNFFSLWCEVWVAEKLPHTQERSAFSNLLQLRFANIDTNMRTRTNVCSAHMHGPLWCVHPRQSLF